jgi:hypothetical protein
MNKRDDKRYDYYFELAGTARSATCHGVFINSNVNKAQGLKPKGFFIFISRIWTDPISAVNLGYLIINRFLYANVSLHPVVSTFKNMDEVVSLFERSGVPESL